MNILQAIDDPRVFAPLLREPETWAAWRVFLASLFALPLDPEQLALYRECTGRAEPPAGPLSEAWLVCGRRGGKSFMLALSAVFLSSFRDWRPHLGPGERANVVVVAADRRQARVVMRYIRGILSAVPMLARTVEAERQEALDLASGVSIEVHTASFRTVRGYTIVAALLDEISFWPTDEHSANPDAEIIAALRPAMATVPGSIMLCASSPYARKGALWDAYRRHFGKDGDPILVWQAPTRRMNPTVSQHVIDEALAEDPSRAAAEYLAEFRSDIEGFVSREAVTACVDHGVHERPFTNGVACYAFCDPSGGSNDSMTLAISHVEGERAVLDLIREVRPPFSPEGVVGEFCETLAAYKIRQVQGDRYAGEWPREQFAKRGVRYEPADKTASQLFLEMLPLINGRRVGLLDHRRLLDQLINLERRTSFGTGRDSVGHPPGCHDDLAVAAAGAALMATAKRPQTLFGTYNPSGGDGRIHWRSDEPPRPRLRIVSISEQEYLEQKAAGTW